MSALTIPLLAVAVWVALVVLVAGACRAARRGDTAEVVELPPLLKVQLGEAIESEAQRPHVRRHEPALAGVAQKQRSPGRVPARSAEVGRSGLAA